MTDTLDDAALPDHLLTAIGRVATSTALLEDLLRFVVAELAGIAPGQDGAWLIFEGQSMDWLISNGRAVLRHHPTDDHGDSQILSRHGTRLLDLFKQAEKLREDRNMLIHGVWYPYHSVMFMGEDCEPRSADTFKAEEVFRVLRSRYRKVYEEQAWSVADIEDVARALRDLARELEGAFKAIVNLRLGSGLAAGRALG